jgi:hypothetical protein
MTTDRAITDIFIIYALYALFLAKTFSKKFLHSKKSKNMTKTKRTCEDCNKEFEVLESEKWKTLCKSCFIEFKKYELDYLKDRVKQLETENKRLKANSDLLKRLKHLCHPDKHNGSPLSRNVFAVLGKL